MGTELSIVTPLHKKTKRDYLARMIDEKIFCMGKAREYEQDYWDGDRRFGYGGYRYDGRWKVVAEALIDRYKLTNSSSILDVGCGKAHLLFEIHKLLPQARIVGFDVSKHGLADAPEEVKPFLFNHKAQTPYPFKDKEFDLVISLACFHNLKINELEVAVKEVQRVGKQGYIMLESYRNDAELFNLQCWALTAESFFDHDEWVWLYKHFGFTGDYEFIYME